MTTTAISCYGAILATFQLLWMLKNHFRDCHWFRMSVSVPGPNDGIEVKVLNRGGKPSTVMAIHVVAYDNALWWLAGIPTRNWHFYPGNDETQPAPIPAGGIYQEYFSMRDRHFDELIEATNSFLVRYRIQMSHRDRSYSGPVVVGR